jgi:hypothetical protein
VLLERPASASDADVRIGLNLAVFGHDRTLQDPGRRNKYLVGWIAMKRLRQLGGLDYDLRV